MNYKQIKNYSEHDFRQQNKQFNEEIVSKNTVLITSYDLEKLDLAMERINKRSLLASFCFCFRARGLRVIADMIYTKDASKIGSTEETSGFANTDTEPNMMAAKTANK